jgi:hypothetical protein
MTTTRRLTTKYPKIIGLLSALVAATLSAHAAWGGFSLTPGDYYTSNYFSLTITQYDTNGNVVGSLTLPSSLGDEVRGIAFGADNLLYAAVARGTSGFVVLVLDSSGSVHQTYPGSVYIAGNLSFGKIALDSKYLYVAGQDSLTRFALGDPSSRMVIYTNNQVFDVKLLPSGNLFVASAYQIDEITNAGTFVRTISLTGDDNGYTDIRGIEYNPATNDLFVTELGHTGFFFQIMRLDGTSGVLEKNTTFNYADDMFLTTSGKLLVGSRTQAPQFYDRDLNPVGMLGGGQQMFVTQYVGSGDTTPPTIHDIAAKPNLLWPPNKKMVPVDVTVNATDDSGTVTCKIVSVTSNEPGKGEFLITGDLNVNLQAARNGYGNGRVYTIDVQCKDPSNNATSATVQVKVPHDQGK